MTVSPLFVIISGLPRRAAVWIALLSIAACTDPVARTQVLVSIDADESLRSRIRYVDIEIRSGLEKDTVWDIEKTYKHVLQRSEDAWPIRIPLVRDDDRTGYQVTATAKDANDATLGVQLARSGFAKGRQLTLMLKFDEACAMRASLCPETYSCRDGRCIDPYVDVEDLSGVTEPGSEPTPPRSGPDVRTEPEPDAGTSGGAPGSTGMPTRAGSGANDPCTPGQPGCMSACPTRDARGVCQRCPTGFADVGADGCVPVLIALRPSRGTLAPSFDPEQTMYTADVPLLASRVTLELEAEGSIEVMVNGEALTDAKWTGPVRLGDNAVAITLNAPGRPSRTYRITLRRGGRQLQKLTAADGSAGDGFGRQIAASGDHLVIGAPHEDGSGGNVTDSGAAYVFERRVGGWEQVAYLKADAPRAQTHFGHSVAIDGERLAVAAPEEAGGGAVYVFELQGGAWTRVARFSGEASGALLGRGLAMQGDRIVAGAPSVDAGADEAGALYVFEREAGGWKRTAMLSAMNPGTWDWLGSCVALDGDTVVTGATGRTVPGESVPSGAVYVFEREASGWREVQMIWPDPAEAGAFWGEAIALAGDRLVGAGFFANVGLTGGSAAVFTRGDDGEFQQDVVLRSPNSRAGDEFGGRVLLAGDAIVFGAIGESSAAGGVGTPPTGTLERSGAVYVFDRTDEGWAPAVQIKPEAPVENEQFGRAIAASGDELFVGASGRDASSPLPGAVYVFR